MPARTFSNDGLRFDLDDSGGDGDGDVVILLHGFPETRSSWRHLTPALVEAGHRVLAPDQRGYSPGARPHRRRDYAMPLLVGDVLALADDVGADRFHLVGHDWGGAVAWAVAVGHPDRLASVTSVTVPHPAAFVRSMVSSRQLLLSWYMLAFQLPGGPEAVVRSRRGGRCLERALVRSGLPEVDAAASVDMLRRGGARGALGWYRAIPFGAVAPPARVTVPTLYVYGTDDVALSRKGADLTGRYVDGPYRYEVIEGASHWIPETRADVLGALLVEHLAAHPASR